MALRQAPARSREGGPRRRVPVPLVSVDAMEGAGAESRKRVPAPVANRAARSGARTKPLPARPRRGLHGLGIRGSQPLVRHVRDAAGRRAANLELNLFVAAGRAGRARHRPVNNQRGVGHVRRSARRTARSPGGFTGADRQHSVALPPNSASATSASWKITYGFSQRSSRSCDSKPTASKSSRPS